MTRRPYEVASESGRSHDDVAAIAPGIETGGATRARQIAAVVADAIQLVAAGFLLDLLIFGGTGVSLPLRLIALAGLFLTTLRSLGWPVLLAIQLSFLIREPSERSMLQGMYSLLTCLAAIGVVAYASSFKITRREFRDVFAAILDAAIHGKRMPRPFRSRLPQYPTLAIRVSVLVALVLASMLVFIELPVAASTRELWWQRSLANGLTLWPGPGAVILALALLIAFGHNQWRPINRAQARLYLRSVFMHYLYRDLKMVVVRRLKAARKAAAKSA